MPTSDNTHPIRGIYAITDPSLIADNELLDKVGLAIDGGISVLQYRNKLASAALQEIQAKQLAELCQSKDVCFIVNDDPELAKLSGADGVHMGKEDGAIAMARDYLGPKAIIGLSCYNQIDNALKAQADGADYIAFGRFFNSKTKPQAVQADPSMIAKAKQQLSIPIVGIGGITIDNASILLEQGIDSIALIQGIFAGDNIHSQSQALNRLYQQYSS